MGHTLWASLRDSRIPQVARDLYRAAAILEETGWCQSTYRDCQGRLCLMGAIRESTGYNPGISGRAAMRRSLEASEVVARYLRATDDEQATKFDAPSWGIQGFEFQTIWWNDRFAQDGSQVSEVLRQAARSEQATTATPTEE